MKSLILTAGEGSRLYPITRITPKPLLDVKGKPVLDHIVSNLDSSPNIQEIYVMYPNAFEYQFSQFEKYFKYSKKIELINDKHRNIQENPGSVGGIAYIVKHKKIEDDLLVIAGDNLFNFRIDDFIAFYELKGKKTSIAVYNVKNKNEAKRFGVVELDKSKKIIGFEEKPVEPKSTLVSTLCYILSKHDLHHLDKKIFKENAGELIKHLVDNNQDLYGFEFASGWFDIGTPEDLEIARKEF